MVSALLLLATPAVAQNFEVLGTRALGMGGAFVAVADDATAVYWNPAGLATGPLFDLVVERVEGDALLDGRDVPLDSATRGTGGSAWNVAVATPSLGAAYYRLRSAAFPVDAAAEGPSDRKDTRSGEVEAHSLLTQHFGVTFVQSLGSGVALGTTLKAVRGTSVVGVVEGGTPENALKAAGELDGPSETRFDLDVGLMVALRSWRVGVVARNLRQPEFQTSTAGGEVAADRLKLERQIRAGLAFAPRSGNAASNGPLTVAVDFDLQPFETVYGRRQGLAAGAEGWFLGDMVSLRGGIRLNTLTDNEFGQTPAWAFGFSASPTFGFLIEGQITLSKNKLEQGWGVATKLTF